MNTLQEIPKDQLDIFKENVTNWLKIDSDICELEKKIRELKKRKSQDEKEVTQFMVKFNISDL